MNLEQALKRLRRLRSMRSSLAELISTAQQINAEDPALLAAMFTPDDAATVVAWRKTINDAIETLSDYDVTP